MRFGAPSGPVVFGRGIREVTRRRLGRGGRILLRLSQRQFQLRNARRLRRQLRRLHGQLRRLLSNQGAQFGNDFLFSVHWATLAKLPRKLYPSQTRKRVRYFFVAKISNK